MSARDFALQIDKEWLDAQEDMHKTIIAIAIEAMASVQRRSPVDTGQFRANWLLSVDTPDLSVQEGPGGALAAKSSTAIASYAAVQGFPVIWLQNNLPYAGRLEDGYSKQAPNGMVALTVAELSAKYGGR